MELKDFFSGTPRAALGFSGGTDSSFLLYIGTKLGADIRPYFIKTAFQPEFELRDAQRVAEFCGVSLTILELDVLDAPCVAENPADRCYYCKSNLFTALKNRAAADGYDVIIDGTNASDDVSDRPGMRALGELKVLSPLRDCGVTKDDVRKLSAQAGLFTARKPSYACLATRVPTGQPITAELLQKVERGENALFEMGFTDFRVRVKGMAANVQVPRSQLMRAVSEWDAIRGKLKADFPAVVLDLNGR